MLQLASRCAGRVRVVSTLAIAAFLMFLTAPSFAQNLVQNPEFNFSLAPWTQFLSSAPDPAGAGTATWVASPDVANFAGSGSASITIAAAPAVANAASGIAECFVLPATPVSSVNYGAAFRIPSADAADGGANATVEIRLFSDNACSTFISGAGGSQGQDIVAGIPNDNVWFTLSDGNFQPPNAPLTAGSAQVRAYLRKTGASANGYAMFVDHAFVYLNGSTPVRLQDFHVE